MYAMDTRKDAENMSRLREVFDTSATRNTNFSGNISGGRGYRRAERLVAALHMITAQWPSGEPLRTNIRVEAERMLVVFLSGDARATRVCALSLVSFVRVAATAGLISITNASILTEALDDMLGVIQSGATDEHLLTRDELMPHAHEHVTSRPRSARPVRITDTEASAAAESVVSPARVVAPASRTHAVSVQARAQAIREALSRDEALGIRDIHIRLPEYSEKMIQRKPTNCG